MMTWPWFVCLPAAEAGPINDPLCGAYALHVALKSIDAPLPGLDDLLARLGPVPKDGYSFAQLADAAERYQVKTLGVITTLDRLAVREGRFACIARMGEKHFVCLANLDETQVHLIDPPRMYSLSRDVWNTAWKGEALLISTSELIREEDLPRATNWSWNIGVVGVCIVFIVAWAALQRKGRSRERV